MAVFTPVSRAHLLDFLDDYDVGTLESFSGIRQGTQNTNYHVYTDKGHYILTLFEGTVKTEDLPFFFGLTAHLDDKGIPCPKAIADVHGNIIGDLCEKKAALIQFLEGHNLSAADIEDFHCEQLGQAVAVLHKAAKDFKKRRENSESFPKLEAWAAKCYERAGEIEEGLAVLIEDELAYLKTNWPQGLPAAAIHTDLFPDNVFFQDRELSGFIDFYYAAYEFLVYDLAVILNAWCFDGEGNFLPERWAIVRNNYEEIRPLEERERQAFNVICRGAALRFLITRMHDFLFHDEDNIVTPKDPREYLAKLKFHQQHKVEI